MIFTKKRNMQHRRNLSVLREKALFHRHCITLWKLLRRIGFAYKKVQDKRYVYVYKQPRIIEWRQVLETNEKEQK